MANSYFLTDLSPDQQRLITGVGLRLTPFSVDENNGFIIGEQEVPWAMYALGMEVEALEQTPHAGVLSACLRPATNDGQTDPKVRVLYWSEVDGSASRFVAVTEAKLLPVLQRDVLLFGRREENRAPIENGKFCIHIWSSSRGRASSENARNNQTIFGFRADQTTWRWFAPVGEGEIIENPDSGTPVAELVGNNLYILPPLSCREFPDGVEIYAKILEEVAEILTMDLAERRSRMREKVRATFMRSVSARLDRNIAEVSKTIEQKRDSLDATRKSPLEHLRRINEAKAILRDGISDRQAEEIIGSEFDQLISMPGVEKVAISDDKMTVHTDMIFCQDPRSKKWHKIGKFRIEICWKATEHKVRFFNRYYSISGYNNGMQAPHVFREGNPCLGSAAEVFGGFLRNYQFANLVIYAIQFLGSVNVDDAAGKHINKWPEVAESVVSAAASAA